ncbi:MAG TPA: hypothetical protein VFS10_15105 [Pyrinomonadaceae bacterium]|nr:hypothetical protein [Pyrinomonadaceae bacterium]
MSDLLTIGGVPLLKIWGNFSKINKFFAEGQYEVALKALGDVTFSAGLKSLTRAGLNEATKRENALLGISQLQIAHEAFLQKGEKSSKLSFVPIAGGIHELRRADAYEKAAKVALIIALAYKYIEDSIHANEFIDMAIGNYESSLFCRELAATYSPSPPKRDYNPHAPLSDVEKERRRTIASLKTLKVISPDEEPYINKLKRARGLD